MTLMTESEWRSFLSSGTRTAKLATRRPDGRPHVAPVWFILDSDDLVFTTYRDTVKARNLRRDPRVMLAVDDEQPPFAFFLVEGSAVMREVPPAELLPWTTRIAKRYMGTQQGDAYGKRNAVEGEVLVRVPLTKVTAKRESPSGRVRAAAQPTPSSRCAC
jgi:PPOX class probable F420-dependent enzyme